MSITRSYNKYTDTYYAYDTTYVWDEKAQKKVQKKKCIGKYDPNTGEIIPTGKRGRPSKQTIEKTNPVIFPQPSNGLSKLISKAEGIYNTLDAAEALVAKTAEDIKELRMSLDELMRQLHAESRGGLC